METGLSEDRTICGTPEMKDDLPVTGKGTRKELLALKLNVRANEKHIRIITPLYMTSRQSRLMLRYAYITDFIIGVM